MNDTPSAAPGQASQVSQGSQGSVANGEALPEFPRHPRETYPPQFNALSDHWRAALFDYQRALATAWEARARLALAALKTAQIEAGGCSYKASRDFAQMALQSTESICSLAIYAIGPLPEPKEQRT